MYIIIYPAIFTFSWWSHKAKPQLPNTKPILMKPLFIIKTNNENSFYGARFLPDSI